MMAKPQIVMVNAKKESSPKGSSPTMVRRSGSGKASSSSSSSSKNSSRSNNRKPNIPLLRHTSRQQRENNTTIRTIALMLFSAAVAVQIVPRECANGLFRGESGVLLSTTTTTTNISTHDDDRYLHHDESNNINQKKKMEDDDNNDFRLAYEQSYGFFDDISSAQWRLHQQRYQQHENHHDKRNPLRGWPQGLPSRYYMNNYDPLFTCPHIRRLGGQGDGPKWTCDPHRLIRIAKDRKEKAAAAAAALTTPPQQTNCLVYSIGSAGNFIWEEALAKSLIDDENADKQQQQTACEIHVFDFSGNFVVPGHVEKYNIHFHKWGIKSSYDKSMTRAYPLLRQPHIRERMFTLDEIINKLGHTGYVIDILKIDCEFCEWFGYKDWLNKPNLDIRQLLIETHNLPTPEENPQALEGGHWFPIKTNIKPTTFFDDIEKAGFAMYSKEPNILPPSAGNGVEFAYIKLHPDFFKAVDSKPTKVFRSQHFNTGTKM